MSNYPSPQFVVNPALGSDLSGVTNLTAQMAECSGRRCLAENLARRIQTSPGDLIDDPDYGYDVASLLNDDVDVSTLPRLASAIETEWEKDERVVSAQVSVAFVPVGTGLSGKLQITSMVTDSQGPFLLVLAVSAATVTILQVGTGGP